MDALLYLYQLPQHLLGLVLIKALKAEKRILRVDHGIIEWYYFRRKGWFSSFISGVSLGNYILLPFHEESTIKHEHGHSIQSQRFGFIYLLAVGIPSALRNLYARRLRAKGIPSDEVTKWYYGGYPEKQADELGGVKR